MSAVKSPVMRCTPEECRQLAKRAQAIHPALADTRLLAQRARVFQALGSATRLVILGLLAVQELCLCDIATALGGAASTLVHHLRVLEGAGLITSRQEGRFTLYELNAAAVRKYRGLAP